MHAIRSHHLSADLLQSRAGGLARYVDGLVRSLSVNSPVTLTGIGEVGSPGVIDAKASLLNRVLAVRRFVTQHLPEIDLLASHFALYAAGCLDLLGKRPHVVHFHGPWASESAAEGAGRVSTFAKRVVERRVYATADRAITLSSAFARILVNEYRVPEEIVRVIPGGIDLPTAPMPSRVESRNRLGWPTDRPIVLCVRRLARRMGLDVLIEAAAVLRKSCPDALIYIAGKGQIQAELQARIESAGLCQNVKLLGFVPDDQLSLAYAAADVSIVPSQSLEGFGLVTLESLVQGTPVLVTPVGGLPEVVSDLSPLLVLEHSNADAIAAGLREAIVDPGTLPSRETCRDYAVSRFSWPRIAERVLGVYTEAASVFHNRC